LPSIAPKTGSYGLFSRIYISRLAITPKSNVASISSSRMAMTDQRPIVLHLGDDIKWNHELYYELQSRFQIARSYSMTREEFKHALHTNEFGDFVAMYRPFWATGGEMGNWDDELMYVFDG
jgi:hypothetical protein